ncbi:hypothetical protein R5R35_004831 [Gryllus longicercus]|uniref:Uncharacterized protein n=1 Tax=Gryllus longicercus TaxID=2509291 RepID=A0AAN9Z9L0_9ORTH
MEEINILSESIIKIESVKEEPVDVNDDDCWNDYVSNISVSVILLFQKENCGYYGESDLIVFMLWNVMLEGLVNNCVVKKSNAIDITALQLSWI